MPAIDIELEQSTPTPRVPGKGDGGDSDTPPPPAAMLPQSIPGRTGSRHRGLRRGIAATLTLIVIALVIRAWQPQPVSVVVTEATEGPLAVTVTEDGQTRVKDRYAVSTAITGTLRRIVVRPGDTVRRGDVVAQVIPLVPSLLDARTRAEAETRLEAARAALRQAEAATASARTAAELATRDAGRLRALLSGGAVAVQAVEQAEATVRMRTADLASAEAGLRIAEEDVRRVQATLGQVTPGGDGDERLTVRSPISGRVLRVAQESEGVVQAGTTLLELGDPGQLEFVVDVLSTDAVSIPAGALVILDRWGGDSVLHGRVQRIEPSAFTRLSSLGVEEQRVNVVVALDPAETRGRLGDGYRVEARIVTWQTPSALQVPAGSLFQHDDGWAVYLVTKGRARLTPVTIGRGNGEMVQILAGLQAGTQVINYPGDNIAEGIRVKPRP